MSSEPLWCVIADSVVGTSHKGRSQPCQDAHCYRIRATDPRTLIVALADGAGSASRSEIGAKLACDQVINRAEHLGESSLSTEAGLKELISGVHQDLVEKAAKLSAVPRELACTLLFAWLSPTVSLFAQVGDGAIVVERQDHYETVFWPEPQEYANVTDFLTEGRFLSTLQTKIVQASFPAIALLSDGLQRLSLDFATKTPHDAFFRGFFHTLRTTEDTSTLSAPLHDFLSSERVNNRTDDDKTLLLAALRL